MENRRIWTRRSVLLLVVLVALVACVFVGLVVPSGAQTIIPRPAAAVVQELTLTRPDEVITRAEAADALARSFQLPKIKPLITPEPVQKKFEYTDPLGVIDEGFAVPSASDITTHPLLESIEGLYKVRAVDPGDGLFRPDEPATIGFFVDAMARVIFGVDAQVDRSALLAAEFGIQPVTGDAAAAPVTRQEAARILNAVFADPDGFATVTVLVTSDIHGHLEPYKPGTSTYFIGGMSRLAKFVEDFKAANPNVVLLDIGDAPYNTNVANLFEGKPVIEVMNLMGYDAMAIGNHDFDYPQETMKRNALLADFPFLSANTYRDGYYPAYLLPRVMLERAGRSIAVIGLTDHNSAVFTHPNNVKGITFKNHFEAAAEQVEMVRGKADVVIVLARTHGDNYKLSTVVDGIDFVMGGGNDVVAFPQLIGDAWLISPGKHSEAVVVLNINFSGDEIIGFNSSHVFITENLPEHPVVSELVAGYVAELDVKMGETIGYTEVFLDGERATVRLKESNLGNLVADALAAVTEADIAFQNGGGIRASIQPGPITLKDIYTILPFDNRVVVIEATGEIIWQALENGVSAYPGAAGQFLQVSGLKYTFDAAQPAGSRIVSVTVDDKPIELDKVYRVVANDFLTGGGDYYTMLVDCKIVADTKLWLRDAFTEYLRTVGTVAPELEGRITILNEEN